MQSWRTTEMLTPALRAARKALRDLEPEDVPAALRRIAAHAGRRLPPPLALRLIEALDENDWLRDKAAESAIDLDVEGPDPARAVSALFLRRPEGWEERATVLAERREAGAREALIDGLRKKIGALEKQLETAREKARAAQDRARGSHTIAEKRVQAVRSAAEAARREERRSADDLRRAHEALATEHERLMYELDEAGERIAFLRDELLRARRSERGPDESTGPQVWATRDPLSLARLLDDLAGAVRPDVEQLPHTFDGTAEQHFILARGVAPDGAEAIRWLLTRTTPYSLIVDGYNVTYLLDPHRFQEKDLRDRLNQSLARFRRMAAVSARVIVVYDSTQSGGVTTTAGPGGVEVRYGEAGHAADDEIVALASALTGDVAVVSTDRTVREASEESGALGLWSEALVEWIGSR